MQSIQINGHVDDQHRLVADVPVVIPPGPVTVWIKSTADEDDAGAEWTHGVTRQWADELSDTRQDIYSRDDGEPIDPA